MIIVHVSITVHHDMVDSFLELTKEKVRCANELEEGVNFTLLQSDAASCDFIIVENYAAPALRSKHKTFKHYLQWRDAVEPMMQKPRSHILLNEVHNGV